jgi:hypothetical protein
MSIESEIANLSEVIEKLIVVIGNQQPAPAPAPVVEALKPAPAPAPVVEAPKPTPAPAPAPAAMPAPPVFETPAPVAEAMKAQQESVPFSDSKGLIDYVMKAYKEMGVQKGAEIQKVLVQCGYQNINEVRPESYYGIYRGVEALRAG